MSQSLAAPRCAVASPFRSCAISKKVFLGLALALVANAHAGWTQITRTSNAIVYVNKEEVVKSDGTARMWTLFDHARPRTVAGTVFSSRVSLVEYDCDGRRSRVLEMAAHQGRMGKGRVLVTYKEPFDWSAIELDTIGNHELRAACQGSDQATPAR